MSLLADARAWINVISENPGVSKSKGRAIARAARWQIANRVGYDRARVRIGPAELYCYPGHWACSGALCTGFLEWDETAFMLRFLRPDDHFVDVGANIGAFSVFAATHVPGVTVSSIEPGDDARELLIENLMLNGMPTNRVLDCAVGAEAGEVNFTLGHDAMNAVARDDEEDVVTVQMRTIDDLFGDRRIDLIKVDVEGIELEVFRGAIGQLGRSTPPVVIFELNGLCLNFDIAPNEVTGFLAEHGYACFEYDGEANALVAFESDGVPDSHNLVATRDLDFVTERLRTAQPTVDLLDLQVRSSLERLASDQRDGVSAR